MPYSFPNMSIFSATYVSCLTANLKNYSCDTEIKNWHCAKTEPVSLPPSILSSLHWIVCNPI